MKTPNSSNKGHGVRPALVLLLIAWPALGVVAQASGDSTPPDPGESPPSPGPSPDPAAPAYTCDRLDRIPRGERCAFVREQCDSDSRIPYTEWYHCHVAPHGALASAAFTLLLVCLLPLLFTLLGDTAEVYFSPIMTHISQSIPKMRPRFAGVTFVAIGNGAPDLSSNISAIRNGDVLLSAGALTGAAMFVQCVVASEVMRASGGPVKCRGATLRDVGIYCASVLLVLAAFAHGRISYWFIAGAVLLYLSYAVWVFVGDEWHEAGRPAARTVWAGLREAVEGRLGRRNGEAGGLPWAQLDLAPVPDGDRAGGDGVDELAAPLVAAVLDPDEERGGGGGGIRSRPTSPDGRQRHHSQSHHHHLVSAKAYQSMVWADLNPAPEEGQPGLPTHGSPRRRRRGPGRQPSGASAARSRVGAAGSSLELGHTGSYVAPSPQPPESSMLSARSAGFGSIGGSANGGGGSQLFTLSSQDGSVLPVPAPVDAAPAGPSAASLPPAPGSAPSATASRAAKAGETDYGAVPWSSLPPAAVTTARSRTGMSVGSSRTGARMGATGDPWVIGDGVVDGEDEDGSSAYSDEEEGEEADLLGAQRGRRRGGGSDGGDDGASVASSRRPAPPLALWERVRYELTVGSSAEWDALPADSLRGRWRRLSFPLLLPVYAALRCTIPFVDPASYSRPWLLTTCVGAPLLAALYLAPGSLAAAITAATLGAALAGAVAYFTAGEAELPDWDCGTSFAFGPAGFAVFGFFMGVLWIDTLASEAVGIISLLASVMRVPASVMGLTLMAWGNSLGDFFGNPAMARRGQPSMALTACFAGPLFNMLASLALGFGSYFARHRVGHAEVVLRPEVALGCVFLLLYNGVVAVTGLLNRGSLPERFYVFARAWYALYFAAACVLGLAAGQSA